MSQEITELIDGNYVIEEFLLTKGEEIVSESDMTIPFKPLIDFALIVYCKKVNATNRFAMKYDLERFFMRRCLGELHGGETKRVKVSKEIFDKVKKINAEYRNKTNNM